MQLYFANKSQIRQICFGILIGISFSQLYQYLKGNEDCTYRSQNPELPEKYEVEMNDIVQSGGQTLFPLLENIPKFSNKIIRLLCWVMTSPINHERRAKYVKQTWGKRCHILVFISTKYDEELPTVALTNITEGRVNLWGKTRDAFRFVHENYGDSMDFILKADDDTYVIVENLLHLLEQYDPKEMIYLGCEFKEYMSGGAGYVLSKATVKLLVEEGLSNPSICKQGDDGIEDVELGKCLKNLNISISDSRDKFGKHRFLPLRLIDHVNLGRIKKMHYDWFWNYIKYKPVDGPECCSKYPISFHYIESEEMIAMDHLVYNVRVYQNPKADENVIQSNGINKY